MQCSAVQCSAVQVSRSILETVSEDYDEPFLALKHGVESLYLGSMASASQRRRIAKATREDIRGISFLADNVGIVSMLNDINSSEETISNIPVS